jgi:very-short-patch-repair endonuclease
MTRIFYHKYLKSYAVKLRNDMTPAEKMLWSKIKCKKIFELQFCRQFPVGKYILDFYCKPLKIAIEVDGPYHFTAQGLAYDANRDGVLNSYGIFVLRFTNEQVMNDLQYVINEIKLAVKTSPFEGAARSAGVVRPLSCDDSVPRAARHNEFCYKNSPPLKGAARSAGVVRPLSCDDSVPRAARH